MESDEDLAVSLDPKALQRLLSMAEGAGISLNELANGILLEAVKELEDAHEG